MGSLPDPGGDLSSPAPSFDDFQKQASLMTSCTLLWRELSDHFASLEQDLRVKSEAIRNKIQTLDSQTKDSLAELEKRELTIQDSVKIALGKVDRSKEAALFSSEIGGEVDDSEGMLLMLKSFCLKMDSGGFWRFITARKKELDMLRSQMSVALAECVDPPRFALEAISEVFPLDKRAGKTERVNDLGWACVLVLESLIPVMVDPMLGKSRLLVTPVMKDRAKEIAETWKTSSEQRGGIENIKTPDVHTFLQHLVTFSIFKEEDVDLYRKLVVGSAWRKQMPRLAIALGLGDKMSEMIEELISRGQQVDAVHFIYGAGLAEKFPPAPLLKEFLNDAKKAAASILEDHNNAGRSVLTEALIGSYNDWCLNKSVATRKEQSALRAVIRCIEEYKLEAEFVLEDLKKRLEQLEKASKAEKKRPVVAAPANKRTRASTGGPMPPAKAGRSTNAYVSSFPTATSFMRSPSQAQCPVGVVPMYGSRSPPSPYPYSPEAAAPSPYAYSPEAAAPSPYAYSPEAAAPSPYVYSPEAAVASPYVYSPEAGAVSYPAYGGYGSGLTPVYQQAYY